MTPRERANEQSGRLIESFADSCDGLIYHYTSPENLRSIIDNGELWLTNTAFVNDTTEGNALRKETDLFKESDFVNKEIWDQGALSLNGKAKYYIISFSKGENMLGQWRAYGSFCIGFEAQQLVRKGFSLYDCVYTREAIKAWLLEKDQIKEWKGDHLDEKKRRLAAGSLIYIASKKYKSRHYESEQEVRLITVSEHSWSYPSTRRLDYEDPPIHFRDHPVYKVPIPYVKFFVSGNQESREKQYGRTDKSEREIKAEKRAAEDKQKRGLLPIKEVRIGPMANQKDAELACRILLDARGYKSAKVICSKIPNR
ncbi:MAG TPA: DUF2971 domain-containing protein [Phycisphaerales bacterium]|nr:DUF2971 domain-containing protein [Phycisphaerales bacterium]